MKRQLGRLGKPLLAAIATLVGLGLCEVATRLLGGAPDVIPIGISSENCSYIRSKNPYLSYELKSNYRNEEADLKFDHPRTNSHGQRDVERSFEKPPNGKRILLLGDSVVVGFGIRDIDHLMSRQMEKLFRDKTVEVLNLAVCGYCTRAEIELLKTKGLRYDPDVVIMVFVENDFHNFNREARTTDGINNRPALVNSLYQNSHLFRMACLNLDLFGFGMETDPAHWNQLAIGQNNVVEGLRLLRDLAIEYEFETVVTAWPAFTNTEIKYNDVMFMPDNRNELIIERLSGALGLPCVRLDKPFREHWMSDSSRSDSHNPRTYYTVGDEMHPSIEGHRVAANILHRVVMDQRLLESHEWLRTVKREISLDDINSLDASMAARALGTEKSDYAAVEYNRGKDLMKQGKMDEAIEHFRKSLSISDRYSGDVHVDIGYILFERGQVDEALGHYRQALNTNPLNYFAHINMGNAMRVQNKLPEAISHFRKAINIRPEQFEGHYNLASTLASQKNHQAAIHHFTIARQLDPSQSRVPTRLGQLYESIGKLSEAVKHYQRAVELNPNDAAAYNHIGLCHAKSGRMDEATDAFRRATEIEPDNTDYLCNLGKALNSRNQLDEAIAFLERACQLAPGEGNAWNLRGVVLAKMKRYDQAAKMFSKALEVVPDHADAKRNLANAKAMSRTRKGS